MRRDLIDRTLAVRAESRPRSRRGAPSCHDLYTNAPRGYYSLDDDGLFVRINDTALRWLGCRATRCAASWASSTSWTPTGRQYFHARFPRLKRDGRIFDIEYDLIGRNGHAPRVIGSASAVTAPTATS